MRLTTEMWVKALLRRVFGDGGFAAVERTGSAEAGAIFIRVRGREGDQSLLSPAPQSLFDTAKPSDRTFEIRLAACDGDAVDAVLERERNFDPDLWVVEIETDDPERYLSVMPA
ncbi:DUF1491 family protein [Nitratireductor sp. XY-223]|uniref:DUF1491 family protein n=1 Tax=Nitratireductor sp. XY-223 TaxID=2561926 RepID=UPI0010A9B28E|nr:DUF1491 family protein [Nitratireductor sp. XY-223]